MRQVTVSVGKVDRLALVQSLLGLAGLKGVRDCFIDVQRETPANLDTDYYPARPREGTVSRCVLCSEG
jgi:hypothetical protein